MEKKKIILVEPDFPIPQKSRNHKNFLPIGLLKIAAYLRDHNAEVKLVRGIPKNLKEFIEIKDYFPDEVWVTSLFTYWAKYVREAVQYYKRVFPNAIVKVGGVFASLFPVNQVKTYTGCDEVYQGVLPQVEKYIEHNFPAYDLIENINPRPIDYQILHASRGCARRCSFCGTYKIEPNFLSKKSIKNEIKFKKLVFYDNNLLVNPHIENTLQELIDLRKERKVEWVESQSGFDGRILLKKPHLAQMIYKAGFRYPRIAWDWKYDGFENIKKQIDLLIDAGYELKGIFIFMIYNWGISFEEMERKRIKCWDWKVQIADCRYRPLDQLFDNYNSKISGQTNENYYIHEKAGWIDDLVKQFRRNVRRQNICIRHGFPFYSKDFEHKQIKKKISKELKNMNTKKEKIDYLKKNSISYWFPNRISYPERNS